MKVWWGLAASALSLVIIVLGYTAMVAGLPTTERLARNEVVVGIDVPLVGTVGDYPDPQHRHVVNLRADGRTSVEGRTPATYGELVIVLKELAAISEGEPISGTKRFLSGESFVIRADAASAWRDASAIVQACAEASAERVFFVVRHETDGAEGALAAFLPTDSCCPGEGVLKRIAIVPGDGGGDPAAAYASVREAAKESGGRLAVEIDAAGEVTTGTVLTWLDAALRGGAAFNGFAMGTPIPKLLDPLPIPGPPATSRVRVRWGSDEFGERAPGGFVPDAGVPLGAAPAMPAVGRLRGGFAGQAVSFRPWHR